MDFISVERIGVESTFLMWASLKFPNFDQVSWRRAFYELYFQKIWSFEEKIELFQYKFCEMTTFLKNLFSKITLINDPLIESLSEKLKYMLIIYNRIFSDQNLK